MKKLFSLVLVLTLSTPAFAVGFLGGGGGGEVDTESLQGAIGADPNADRIIFWDDSEGAFKYLAPGTGLGISTTTLNLTTMTTEYDLIRGGSSGVPTRLAGPTAAATLVLRATGNGSATTALGWTGADSSNLPSLAPSNATYITQTSNGNLTSEQALSSLSTGLVKVTTGTGVLSSVSSVEKFGITIDGGGSAITTGQKGYVEIPFACTITGWTLLGDQSGSIVIDVWKDTYANYPPTVADTIAGSEKPTISAATKGQDLTLTTWTTAVTAGDIIGFNVDSASTITRATLVVRCQR